jgi:hypothetical protein
MNLICYPIFEIRRALLLVTLLYAGAVALAKAAPEQPLSKNALLIANAEYKGLGSLPNPIPDARLLSESLRKIGFEVVLLENGNREQMLDAVDAFQNRLKSSKGISLFHFGGHGIQMDGRNYMIPAHTEIPDDRKLLTRAVDLDEVMTSLDEAGSFANVVVLDACRDNPLTARSRSVSRGLAAVQTQPKNTLIVYAAESGKKAEDGLFTPVFARTLAVPGLSLSRLLQQVRSEVHKLSNGQQTPGAYDQTFDEVFLNDGGPSKLEIVIPSSPSPVENTSPAMPAPLTVTPPSPQAQQTHPQATGPLPGAMGSTIARASSGHGLERISQNYDPNVTYQKFSPTQLTEVESLIRSDNLCKAADAEMEAVYNRMRLIFGQNSKKKETLKSDQLNWLHFRTAVLNSVPMNLRSTVFVQLTRERVNYLRVW